MTRTMSGATVEGIREEVRERRRRERIRQARRLRGRSPGETLEAAFQLTAFARELGQVDP